MTLGATPDDWFHFDFILGLGSNLLPCVPAGPDVKVLKGSALEGKVGKIPSQFNHAGEAHGLKDWQKREIMSNEIVAWSKDPRLNICVRTGPISGVYALDVDVDDPATAMDVSAIIGGYEPNLMVHLRTRPNSSKFLIPFRMDASCKKRRIKVDSKQAIELLADGQQFVAAGTHSSGVRYQWSPSLPEQLPVMTLAQLDALWSALTSAYSPETSSPSKDALTDTAYSPRTATVDTQSATLTSASEADWQQLLESLRFLTDKVADNDTWSEVGYALLSLQGSRPAQRLWEDFSKKAVGYVEGGATAWWNAHANQTPRTDFRHIFKMARDRGLARVADPSAFALVESAAPDTVPAEDSGPSGADDATINVLPDSPIKPLIQLADSRFPEIVDQLEHILVPYVYVQGPHLVRETEAYTDEDITRGEDALMLIRVTREWAFKKLGALCTWQKWLKGDANWVTTKPSVEHVNNLMGQGGWTQLRPLDAIARAPFVRPDGSICDTAGYDRRSRVLYVPSTAYPGIPAMPDRDCALAALGRLRGVFDQFPWKEPASESAFLAHILTEAARTAIDTSPMFFYGAPNAGTGKSLLQDMAARIVHGSNPALRAWVSDGDEVRKVLYAALLAGDRSLWFDNMPDGHKTRSSELCAFITSATWTDRKLGESESLGIPNKMVLCASGNNVTPTGDLARRSLVIRLDANTERLKERVFKIPEGQLRPYVMENRPQMLVDALTIIKAFHSLTDKPKMPVALSSFGKWSHYCRDPLIWLGMPDPVITQNETDDETTHVGVIYERLMAEFGDREFTGLDVARLVSGITDASGELATALQENGCSEPHQPKKVGYWLRGCRDRISHGIKLVNAGNVKTGVKWKFVKMEEALT